MILPCLLSLLLMQVMGYDDTYCQIKQSGSAFLVHYDGKTSGKHYEELHSGQQQVQLPTFSVLREARYTENLKQVPGQGRKRYSVLSFCESNPDVALLASSPPVVVGIPSISEPISADESAKVLCFGSTTVILDGKPAFSRYDRACTQAKRCMGSHCDVAYLFDTDGGCTQFPQGARVHQAWLKGDTLSFCYQQGDCYSYVFNDGKWIKKFSTERLGPRGSALQLAGPAPHQVHSQYADLTGSILVTLSHVSASDSVSVSAFSLENGTLLCSHSVASFTHPFSFTPSPLYIRVLTETENTVRVAIVRNDGMTLFLTVQLNGDAPTDIVLGRFSYDFASGLPFVSRPAGSKLFAAFSEHDDGVAVDLSDFDAQISSRVQCRACPPGQDRVGDTCVECVSGTDCELGLAIPWSVYVGDVKPRVRRDEL